jgi:aminoglycoside phosphotransferase (APT) family kinase protein
MGGESITITDEARRAAAITCVVADQLSAMAGQIPEPALATPLGFFGEALAWAKEALAQTDTTAPAAAAAPGAPPAADASLVESYLRNRFSDPAATVSTVDVVGGGYSKYTILVTATVNGIVQELALRQLPAGRPNDLPEEFSLIQQVWSPDLPVPEPLWLEPTDNDLGGPFFATRRLPGSNLGDVMGASGDVPAAFCEDLAAFLARLHQTDTGSVTATAVPSMASADDIHSAIDDMTAKVRARGVQLPTRATAVLDWLHANVPAGPRPLTVVHGDVGLHNCLAAGGRLMAVLDWERGHLGDPGEDLAYLRPSLEPHYPWNAFVERYVAAGGHTPEPEVERFYTVWQDTWRYLECAILAEDFLASRAVPMMIAGYVLGPKFLASAAKTAFDNAEEA